MSLQSWEFLTLFLPRSHFGRRDLDLVKSIAADEDVLGLVVGSLAPQIYGHELVKLGLVLGLFGGTDADDDDRDRDAARAAEEIGRAHV